MTSEIQKRCRVIETVMKVPTLCDAVLMGSLLDHLIIATFP